MTLLRWLNNELQPWSASIIDYGKIIPISSVMNINQNVYTCGVRVRHFQEFFPVAILIRYRVPIKMTNLISVSNCDWITAAMVRQRTQKVPFDESHFHHCAFTVCASTLGSLKPKIDNFQHIAAAAVCCSCSRSRFSNDSMYCTTLFAVEIRRCTIGRGEEERCAHEMQFTDGTLRHQYRESKLSGDGINIVFATDTTFCAIPDHFWTEWGLRRGRPAQVLLRKQQ